MNIGEWDEIMDKLGIGKNFLFLIINMQYFKYFLISTRNILSLSKTTMPFTWFLKKSW